MKPWQLISGFCAALVIVGILLCDDLRAHNDLRDCQKAVGLKPETTFVIIHPPKDSQTPQGFGIHPAHQSSGMTGTQPANPHLTALKAPDTFPPVRDTSKNPISTLLGMSGGNPAKIDTFCIDDTTIFPDSEKIYHQLCSPDLKPTSLITDLWTLRIRPPDSQKTISKPIIITRTPWWAHWYIQLPIGTALAYAGYRVGKAQKDPEK